ncbi:MAG: ATP-binding protein, partial [Myxococcota bacterium]
LRALERMGDRWHQAEGTPRDLWADDAGHYVADYGGFRAIEWIDADGVVRWVVPTGHEEVVGDDVDDDPVRGVAMREAWRRGRAAVSPPVPLRSGGTGVVVYVPLHTRDRFDGWIAGVFHIQELVAATMGSLEDYRVTLAMGDEVLYADPGEATDICSVRVLGVFYLGWRVEVCAGPTLEEALRGQVPELTLAVGLAFTALTAGLLLAVQMAADRETRSRALARTLREKADALERAQAELAELSWSVSHELRTPLRAIDGYAAIVAEEAPPERRPALERIRANAQRMARQLDGLVELLRVARAEVRVRDVDVSALARERLARRQAAEPERAIAAQVDDGIVVRGDERLLAVVVDAIIDNAWKFTAGREPGHIHVTRAPRGFVVQDDGVGFDMAFAHKLFATFERLHAPGEFDGLGLGLAIAARAVARHGGEIRAEGTPGKGAVVVVELPG